METKTYNFFSSNTFDKTCQGSVVQRKWLINNGHQLTPSRVHWENIQKIGVHNNDNNCDNDDDDDDDDDYITPGHKVHWFNTEVHDSDSGCLIYAKIWTRNKLSPYSVKWYQFTVLIL